MDRRRRWDTDERGSGAADARAWRPMLRAISAAADEEGWIAEEPELHLLPHLERATAGGPLAIRATRTETDGTFAVDLDWVDDGAPARRAIQSALFALVAAVAETAVVLYEPPASQGRVLEVLSGSGGDDGPFAGHGHTLRLTVSDPAAASARG